MSYFITPIAPQRVLTTPELLGEILSWLRDDFTEIWKSDQSYVWQKTLIRNRTLTLCARVNGLWYREAMRHLWKKPSLSPSFSLPHALSVLAPARRQFYANFIASASLIEVQKSTIRQHNRTLRKLAFPNLHSLTLILDLGHPLFWMPSIRAPALRTFHLRFATITKTSEPVKFHLDFNPQPRAFQRWTRSGQWARPDQSMVPRPIYSHRLSRALARKLAKQIRKRFGNIKTLAFGPELKVDAASLKCFTDALPSVVLYTEHPGFVKRTDLFAAVNDRTPSPPSCWAWGRN